MKLFKKQDSDKERQSRKTHTEDERYLQTKQQHGRYKKEQTGQDPKENVPGVGRE